MSTLTGLVDHLLAAPAWLVYLGVFGIVFAEDAVFLGFLLPGETAALLGGVAANLGHVSLPAVLAVAGTAAVLGDTVGYAVGRRLGPAVLDHRLLVRRRAALDRAADLLARRGGVAVLLGRWTAFFRAVTPALAGSARMPYPRFLLWNALGGILWATTVVLIGYLAGASYATAASALGHGTAVAAALLLLAGLVTWRVAHRRGRAADASSAPSHDEGATGDHDREASRERTRHTA